MKNHKALFPFLLLVLFFMGSCSSSKILTVSDIDKKAQQYASQKKNQGLVVGYIVNGERHVKGYGTKSRTDLSVPDENSVFEIGALTETFTATIMQQLAEENLFDPSDCANHHMIRKYNLPDYNPVTCVEFNLPPPPSDPGFPVHFSVTSCSRDFTKSECISLCNLASHTSGLRFPNYKIYGWNLNNVSERWKSTIDLTPRQLFKLVSKNGDVIFEPGKYHRYSSVSVALLGNLMAKSTKKPYAQLLDEYLLFPLKLGNTSLGKSNNMLKGHDSNGKVTNYAEMEAMLPAGGLSSNVNDLLTFLETQINPSEKFEGAIERTHDIKLKIHSRFGLKGSSGITNGWFATRFENQEDLFYWKNGGTKGFNAFMAFNKETQSAVVILSNSVQPVRELGFELIQMLRSKNSFPTAAIHP